MAIDIGLRIMQLLDSIGIKGGSYLGKASNVKKAFTGGKPTFFKPDVLETLRSQDGNFSDALKLLEEGYAPEILLTDEKKRSIRFSHLLPNNEMIAQAMIEELGLMAPVSIIQSQKGGATSTFDEAYDLLKLSEKKKYRHLILVTDAFHSRRAYHAFQTVFEETEINIEMSAASNKIFNENNWWTSDQGISTYVLESIKYPVYLLSSRNVTFIRND